MFLYIIIHVLHGRVNTTCKLIDCESREEAVKFVFVRNKFKNTNDVKSLVTFLENRYESIIEKMKPDDDHLDALEEQKGLDWWIKSDFVISPKPTVELSDICEIGLKNLAITIKDAEMFILRSDDFFYKLEEINFEKQICVPKFE